MLLRVSILATFPLDPDGRKRYDANTKVDWSRVGSSNNRSFGPYMRRETFLFCFLLLNMDGVVRWAWYMVWTFGASDADLTESLLDIAHFSFCFLIHISGNKVLFSRKI